MPRPPSAPMISIIINTAGGGPPQRGIILISSSCQPSFSSPSSLTPFPCRVSPHLRKSPPRFLLSSISSSCQPSSSLPFSFTPFPPRPRDPVRGTGYTLQEARLRALRIDALGYDPDPLFGDVQRRLELIQGNRAICPLQEMLPLLPDLLEVIDRGNLPLTDKGAGRLEERSRLIPSPGTEAFRQHEGAGRSENGVCSNDIGPFCISPHHGLRRLEVLLRPGHETISPGQVRIDRLHQAFCLELLKDHGLTRSGESSSPAEPPAGKGPPPPFAAGAPARQRPDN